MRGPGSGESSNILQLLILSGEDDVTVLHWLEKSAKTHTSPESQNEMLQLMAHGILRIFLRDIQCSPFLAVMVDETTDG